MSLNVNKYLPKKKRNWIEVLQLRYKVYKRKAGKQEQIEQDKKIFWIAFRASIIIISLLLSFQILDLDGYFYLLFPFLLLLILIFLFFPIYMSKKENFIKVSKRIFITCCIIMSIGCITELIEKNKDALLNILIIFGYIAGFIIIASIAIHLIITLIKVLINLLSGFIAQLLDEIESKRQIKHIEEKEQEVLENINTVKTNVIQEIIDTQDYAINTISDVNNSLVNNYSLKNNTISEIITYIYEIEKDKKFPTAEKISIFIDPLIHNILLYFFPNSFKTDEEAYNYYEDFCERAKQLGEEAHVYKCEELLKHGFNIDININMLSGQRTVYNSFDNTNSIISIFPFFSYNDIKNKDLKQEIEKLYLDNWDFLEAIGVCYLYSNGVNKSISDRLDITPYGLDYFTYGSYNSTQAWIGKHHDIFQLPVNEIICAFRECHTYCLREEEREILYSGIFDKINSKFKNIWKFELDFERKHAEIANKFVYISLSVEYFSQAETITNHITGREYKYINPFYTDYYKS